MKKVCQGNKRMSVVLSHFMIPYQVTYQVSVAFLLVKIIRMHEKIKIEIDLIIVIFTTVNFNEMLLF